MVVGNKIDKVQHILYHCHYYFAKVIFQSEKFITREEGVRFAEYHGMLFNEASAKTNDGVYLTFFELAQKVLFFQYK